MKTYLCIDGEGKGNVSWRFFIAVAETIILRFSVSGFGFRSSSSVSVFVKAVVVCMYGCTYGCMYVRMDVLSTVIPWVLRSVGLFVSLSSNEMNK